MVMPDQVERERLVTSAQDGGKPRKPLLPNLNICGDIGLRIARDGTWYYQGSPIGRKPLVKLFASVLRCEEDGFYLVTPVEKVPDAPPESEAVRSATGTNTSGPRTMGVSVAEARSMSFS